jgi:DNA-binding response OmpR family regulator
MPNTRKILIVDDDPELRDALTEQLSLYEEYEAVAAENGSKGVQAAKAGQIDLVIMDVGLPDIDGREAVRILRRNGFKAPIIMLTGHDTDSDTILGLESGANDYVTKPFRFPVLLARIRTLLRQYETSEDAVFTIGPYSFRPSSKLLLNPKGSKVRLTEKESSILGLQLGSHHAHARDAHLSITAKDRAGCRRSGHPGHCRGRLQTDALIAAAMTINGTIEGHANGGIRFWRGATCQRKARAKAQPIRRSTIFINALALGNRYRVLR